MKKSRDKRKAKDKSAASEAVELTDEQISGAAGTGGGGIYFMGGGNLTVSNTTISGNRADSDDGTPDIIVGTGPGAPGGHVK